MNVGIPFKTPDEFFLGEDVKPFTRDFDPTAYIRETTAMSTDASESITIGLTRCLVLKNRVAPILFSRSNEVELVVFCGSPGAGKSSFYWRHLKPLGFERVNQDILKTV